MKDDYTTNSHYLINRLGECAILYVMSMRCPEVQGCLWSTCMCEASLYGFLAEVNWFGLNVPGMMIQMKIWTTRTFIKS